MLEKFEIATLFDIWLHVGLPSTLIHRENEAFSKLSSNWWNLKTELFKNDDISVIT